MYVPITGSGRNDRSLCLFVPHRGVQPSVFNFFEVFSQSDDAESEELLHTYGGVATSAAGGTVSRAPECRGDWDLERSSFPRACSCTHQK